MKKLLIVLAAVAVVGAGAAVAQGSTRGPNHIPVAELTRQLDAFEGKLMAQEHAIADCMAAEGLNYVPHLPADWVMERATELDHAAGGSGNVTVDIPADPNEAIVAALTPAEVDAYQAAYWGSPGKIGCYDATYQQVFGVNRADELQHLMAVADKVDAALESDPRMTTARTAYVDCMRDEGYEVVDINDVYTMIVEQSEAVDTTAREQGIPVDQAAGYDAYTTFKTAILSAQDACAAGYRTIEDDVKAEYVDKFLNQP